MLNFGNLYESQLFHAKTTDITMWDLRRRYTFGTPFYTLRDMTTDRDIYPEDAYFARSESKNYGGTIHNWLKGKLGGRRQFMSIKWTLETQTSGNPNLMLSQNDSIIKPSRLKILFYNSIPEKDIDKIYINIIYKKKKYFVNKAKLQAEERIREDKDLLSHEYHNYEDAKENIPNMSENKFEHFHCTTYGIVIKDKNLTQFSGINTLIKNSLIQYNLSHKDFLNKKSNWSKRVWVYKVYRSKDYYDTYYYLFTWCEPNTNNLRMIVSNFIRFQKVVDEKSQNKITNSIQSKFKLIKQKVDGTKNFKLYETRKIIETNVFKGYKPKPDLYESILYMIDKEKRFIKALYFLMWWSHRANDQRVHSELDSYKKYLNWNIIHSEFILRQNYVNYVVGLNRNNQIWTNIEERRLLRFVRDELGKYKRRRINEGNELHYLNEAQILLNLGVNFSDSNYN